MLHGLGAVDRVVTTTWRRGYERRTFVEPLEVCSLTGNIALLDGEPLRTSTAPSGVGSRPWAPVFGPCVRSRSDLGPRGPGTDAPRGIDFCNLKLLKLEQSPLEPETYR